jgi:hypothetical protein
MPFHPEQCAVFIGSTVNHVGQVDGKPRLWLQCSPKCESRITKQGPHSSGDKPNGLFSERWVHRLTDDWCI